VQAGDTLQGIAQSAYGDSALWYLVAEANGLSSDADLRVGQTLTIPNSTKRPHLGPKRLRNDDGRWRLLTVRHPSKFGAGER